jgi:hypothetical protein
MSFIQIKCWGYTVIFFSERQSETCLGNVNVDEQARQTHGRPCTLDSLIHQSLGDWWIIWQFYFNFFQELPDWLCSGVNVMYCHHENNSNVNYGFYSLAIFDIPWWLYTSKQHVVHKTWSMSHDNLKLNFNKESWVFIPIYCMGNRKCFSFPPHFSLLLSCSTKFFSW